MNSWIKISHYTLNSVARDLLPCHSDYPFAFLISVSASFSACSFALSIVSALSAVPGLCYVFPSSFRFLTLIPHPPYFPTHTIRFTVSCSTFQCFLASLYFLSQPDCISVPGGLCCVLPSSPPLLTLIPHPPYSPTHIIRFPVCCSTFQCF